MREPIYSEAGKLLAIRNSETNTLEIVRKNTLSIIHFLEDGTYEVKDIPKNKIS